MPAQQPQPEDRDVTFREFIERTDARFQFYWHVEIQIAVLEQFLAATVARIKGEETTFPENMFTFEPVRHGKSELVSRKFPAYCLYRHPWLKVALLSYGANLAQGFARNARDNYLYAGGQLKADTKAVQHWETDQGGQLWSAGVGGTATGKGFDIGIIDDYLKNWDDASSDREREKQWDWYQSTFLRRREPGAGVLITATRWHEDDLAGRIISQQMETNRPKAWHVIHWPAIREANIPDYPEHFTIEPDPREVGEPLCPERYDLEALGDAEADSPFFWSALYQQRPAPMEGAMWKSDDFIAVKTIPELTDVGYDWDLAYTKDDRNSASAYLKSGRQVIETEIDGKKVRETFVYILDFGYDFLEFPKLLNWMIEKGGPHYIEAKAAGKSAKQSLDVRGIMATEVPVVGGDKEARTALVRPTGSSGHLMVKASILDALKNDSKQGVLRFPHGTHDDVNDVLVQAITRHTKRLGPDFSIPMATVHI